jgi:hypothetical protein
MLVKLIDSGPDDGSADPGLGPWNEEKWLTWVPVRDRHDLKAGDIVRDAGSCLVFQIILVERDHPWNGGNITNMELRPIGLLTSLPEKERA